MQKIGLSILLLAACGRNERPTPHEVEKQERPCALEIADEGLQPNLALTFLLKLRDSANAAAFEPAIQVLINRVCGTPGDAPVDVDDFFPMDTLANLRMAGCGSFYLTNGATICGPRGKRNGTCIDIGKPPP